MFAARLAVAAAVIGSLTVPAAGGRVKPPQRPPEPVPAVERLIGAARYEASHGGVLGSCYGSGCATPKMMELARRLVAARFAPAGAAAVATATCIVSAESGFNPGTISETDDWGLAQINRPTWHHTYDFRRSRILDPWYSLSVMWVISGHGRDWHAWTGTWGRGLCR